MKFTLKLYCDNGDLSNLYMIESLKRQSNEWINNKHKDSGVDIYCPQELTISPNTTKKIYLGIKCSLIREDNSDDSYPSPFYLYPRSSISKTPLRMANSVGIIDSGYRGYLIGVVDHIKNHEGCYDIKKHDRLFQICAPDLQPISDIVVVNHLDNTQRGSGGFGSTGT